jgi:LEA14-like dessication related protein
MELLISMVMRILSHLVPSVLRRYYTEKRLVEMIRVTVNSENDGLVVNCSDIPDARVWFEVTNQSPFPIEVRGLSVDLSWGGNVGRFISIARTTVGPHSFERLYTHTTLTGEQAAKIRAIQGRDEPRLSMHLEMSCRLRSFALMGREIKTRNVRCMNCETA